MARQCVRVTGGALVIEFRGGPLRAGWGEEKSTQRSNGNNVIEAMKQKGGEK